MKLVANELRRLERKGNAGAQRSWLTIWERDGRLGKVIALIGAVVAESSAATITAAELERALAARNYHDLTAPEAERTPRPPAPAARRALQAPKNLQRRRRDGARRRVRSDRNEN